MSSTEKIINPSKYFQRAEDVLADAELSTSEKIELLNNWANELRQLQAAEEESMAADTNNNAAKLSSVEQALLKLGAESEPHDAKT